MANIKSQIKRNQTNELARQANSATKNKIRSAEKKVLAAVAEGKKDEATLALKEAIKYLDQAQDAGVLSTNSVNRKKSHLQKAVNAVK